MDQPASEGGGIFEKSIHLPQQNGRMESKMKKKSTFRIILIVAGFLHIFLFFVLPYAKLTGLASTLGSLGSLASSFGLEELTGVDISYPQRLTGLNAALLMKNTDDFALGIAVFSFPVIMGIIVGCLNIFGKKKLSYIASAVFSSLGMATYILLTTLMEDYVSFGYTRGMGGIFGALIAFAQIVVAIIGCVKDKPYEVWDNGYGGQQSRAGHADRAGYGDDAGHAEAADYGDNADYADDAGYGDNAGYANGAGYGNDAGYADGAGYGNDAGYAGYGDDAGYAGGDRTRMDSREGVVECLTGEMQGAQIPLPEGEILRIGRDGARCDLVLKEKDISRYHCEIQFVAGENCYYVTDFSTLGVKVNGYQKLKKEYPQPCLRGSRLVLGDGSIELLLW